MSGWNATSEPVEAILFDLGNTLVSYYKSADFAPILERCINDCAAALERDGRGRVDITAALGRAARCNAERSDYRVWPLVERLATVFALEPDDSRLDDDLVAAFLAPVFATARVDPQALATLHALRRRGIRTAIVSNTPWGSPAEPWRAELRRHGLLDAVDAAVFCVDVGWRKPARMPFDRALALLGAAPERSWFVGDDAIWDVAGARRAGLKPILIGTAPAGEDCVTVPGIDALIDLLD